MTDKGGSVQSVNSYYHNLSAASKAIYSNESNPPSYSEKEHRFSTVHKELHDSKEIQDFTPYKKNYKKKSIFQ